MDYLKPARIANPVRALSRATLRRHERNRAMVRDFTHPPGTRVRVLRARGDFLDTVTESHAFLVDDAHAMVVVAGIPGNTSLHRVEALP